MMTRCSLTARALTWFALAACTSDRAMAPHIVAIAGATLRVDASLWRDFQPISPPDGKPLAAILTVTTIDGSPIPGGLTADSAWIHNGGLVWGAALVEEQPRGAGASFFEVVARNGPKWGPGIAVDVVIQLRDAAGQRALLQAPRQLIARTD